MKAFELYILLSNKRNKRVCQIWKNNLYILVEFKHPSLLHKFKVALNPTKSFFKEVVKMFFLPIEQKYIENSNFHRVVYKLLTLNDQK